MVEKRFGKLLTAMVIAFGATAWNPLSAQLGFVFVPITPCRMVDTRTDSSGGPITGTVRNLTLTGAAYSGFSGGNPCTAGSGVPEVFPSAIAVNFTLVGAAGLADLRVAPWGTAPTSSIMNSTGPTVANAAIETVAPNGLGGSGISVKSGGAQFNLLVDVLGYYNFQSVSDPLPIVFGENYAASGNAVLGRAGDAAGIGILGQQGVSYPLAITGAAVSGTANGGYGVVGTSNSNYGVYGLSATSRGVDGESTSGRGVYGHSAGADGVHGTTDVTDSSAAGVAGHGDSGAPGVLGHSVGNDGVDGVSDTQDGVLGTSTSGNGVQGQSTTSYGVYGTSNSSRGVFGDSTSGRGAFGHSTGSDGVYGTTDVTDNSAAGVNGHGDSGAYGVHGHSSTNYGVHGVTDSSGNDAAGVFGVDGSGSAGSFLSFASAGVRGESHGGDGVLGLSKARVAVDGILITGAGDLKCEGQLGDGIDGFDVTAAGGCGMAGSGPKYFVEPYAGDPSKEIRFVSLEGPESGTYFRGTGQIVNGFATIQVPETFRQVTDSAGLTAVVSPVGQIASLGVISQDLNKIVVQGSADVRFNYMVNGVRRAYKDLNAVHDNVMFIPRGASARMSPSYAPDIRARLVANGIFNADGTVNMETAQKMGWDKKPGWANDLKSK